MAKNSDGTRAVPPEMDYTEYANALLNRIIASWSLPPSLLVAQPRPCARCGIMLDPAFPGDAYCSQRCLDADRAAHAATVPTTDDDPDAEFPW